MPEIFAFIALKNTAVTEKNTTLAKQLHF